MSYWMMYLITRASSINSVFECIGVISGVAVVVALAILFAVVGDPDASDLSWGKKIVKIGVIVFLISSILSCLVPTTPELAAIYLIPKIVNNEQCQKVPENALRFLNKKLETWISETIDPNSIKNLVTK
jgi:hypothetical protein